MNRNYYCKVNSQKEADELLKKLKDIGEDIDRYNYTDSWNYIVYDRNTSWALSDIKNCKEEFENRTEVPASELIDYVTGKKVDKDALLEEAKKRYPVGTKFKSALRGNKHPFQTIVKGNIYLDKVGGRQVIWNGDGCGFIYDDENWAEIVEEPKVETKEEFVLPEYWFLRFKTKEVFDELCKKYAPNFIFFENAGICNNPTKLKLGNYYYLTKDTRYGEEITFDQFKKYVLNQEVKEEVKSMEEWSVGSYAVVVQGQFGIFQKGDSNDKVHPLIKGTIFTINSVQGKSITVKESKYWIYKENCKWFPTLQEAQKFSDELLGKSKSSLRVEDLIEGEIYYWEHLPYKYISKCLGGFRSGASIHLPDNKFTDDEENIKKVSRFVDYYSWNIRNVTSSEKKWLNTCIKQDKFIPQSELDKYDDEGNLMESEEFKDGDWLVYIKDCGLKPSCPIKIGDIKQMLNGSFGTLVIYGYEDLSHCFRKALPHEIPVENSIKQNIITLEECGKFPADIEKFIIGIDPIPTTGMYPKLEDLFRNPESHTTLSSKKTPDLIDKSKVEVKIKRTKVKQIKL